MTDTEIIDFLERNKFWIEIREAHGLSNYVYVIQRQCKAGKEKGTWWSESVAYDFSFREAVLKAAKTIYEQFNK